MQRELEEGEGKKQGRLLEVIAVKHERRQWEQRRWAREMCGAPGLPGLSSRAARQRWLLDVKCGLLRKCWCLYGREGVAAVGYESWGRMGIHSWTGWWDVPIGTLRCRVQWACGKGQGHNLSSNLSHLSWGLVEMRSLRRVAARKQGCAYSTREGEKPKWGAG